MKSQSDNLVLFESHSFLSFKYAAYALYGHQLVLCLLVERSKRCVEPVTVAHLIVLA